MMHDNHNNEEHTIPEVSEEETTTNEETTESSVSTEEEYVALLDKYQRLQAEFINFKKRTESERAEFVTYAQKSVLEGILPSIDTLTTALSTVPSELEGNTWVEGIIQFQKQFDSMLQSKGVVPMDITPGETAFDPELHEAINTEEKDGMEGVVLEVYQQGYLLGDKVLRTAIVKVGA